MGVQGGVGTASNVLCEAAWTRNTDESKIPLAGFPAAHCPLLACSVLIWDGSRALEEAGLANSPPGRGLT